MKTKHLLVPALLLAAASLTSASEPDVVPDDVIESFFRLRVAAAALEAKQQTSLFPYQPDGLRPLADALSPRWFTSKLLQGWSARDLWGGPILYWSDRSHYMLVSLGSDGLPEFNYSANPPYAAVPPGWSGVNTAHDLVIVDGVEIRGPNLPIMP
ncbi:MAG: hypothetical protein LAO51_15470 [Acidobacteriia bacterium]|nr:hypothetical protein [Terriglobia bacterium]